MPRAVDGMTQAEIDRMQAGIAADPEIQAILKRERDRLAQTRDKGGDARKYQHSVRDQITELAKARGYLPEKGQYFVNPNDGQLEPHSGWAGLSKKSKAALLIGAGVAGGYGLAAAGAFGGGGAGYAASAVKGVAAAGGTGGGIGWGTALGLGALGLQAAGLLRRPPGAGSGDVPDAPSLLGADASSAATARAAAVKARKRASGQGRQSTILTGPLGLPSSMRLQTLPLLGTVRR